jgi:hypothetical protein
MPKTTVTRLSISVYPDHLQVIELIKRTVPHARSTSAAVQHIITEYHRLTAKQEANPAPQPHQEEQ